MYLAVGLAGGPGGDPGLLAAYFFLINARLIGLLFRRRAETFTAIYGPAS